MIMLIALNTIFIFPAISPAMLPLYVRNVLQLGPKPLGWLMAVSGTGAFLGPFLGAAVYIVFQDWLSKTTENWHFFLGLAFVLMILYAHDGLIGLFAKDGPARRLLSRRGAGVEETA